MIPTKPDGRTIPQCPRCGQCWVQRGNASGHCAACHVTFYGEAAFDAHQVRDPDMNAPIYIDPMERAVNAECPGYFLDAEGQWHFGDLETATGYDQRRTERAARLLTYRN